MIVRKLYILNGLPLESQIVVQIVKFWFNIKLQSTNLARMSTVSVLNRSIERGYSSNSANCK